MSNRGFIDLKFLIPTYYLTGRYISPSYTAGIRQIIKGTGRDMPPTCPQISHWVTIMIVPKLSRGKNLLMEKANRNFENIIRGVNMERNSLSQINLFQIEGHQTLIFIHVNRLIRGFAPIILKIGQRQIRMSLRFTKYLDCLIDVD